MADVVAHADCLAGVAGMVCPVVTSRAGRRTASAKARDLVAVAVQGSLNGGLHARVDRGRATQVSTSFLADALSQVTGTTLAVHRLARRGQSKPLLGSLVSLDFGFAFGHRSVIRSD